MPNMTLTHFEAALLFALLMSIVMGITGKRSDSERLRYVVSTFGWFVASLFAIGWLMYFGHG